MPTRFVIEDVDHAEWLSEHDSLADAWLELQRVSLLPWDSEPNRPPCLSWRTCGRSYEIIEFETSSDPWTQIRRTAVLSITAAGPAWTSEMPFVD